jgi:putative acetyltransferase
VSVRIRPEEQADRAAVQALIEAAFGSADRAAGPIVEVGLNDELRRDPGWIPELTLVAEQDGPIVGQLTCSFGELDDDRRTRLVGVGPVAVLPDRQGEGIGSLLLRSLIAAADARGEQALILLGSPDFYGRFGFRPAADLQIQAPDPQWGKYFQVLPLRAYNPLITGRFRYAAPFDDL